MKRMVFYLLIVVCTLLYLYIGDDKVKINKDELAKAGNNAVVQKMKADLYEIKQKIIIPAEQKKSYLLNENKIETYKNQIKQQ